MPGADEMRGVRALRGDHVGRQRAGGRMKGGRVWGPGCPADSAARGASGTRGDCK